MKTAGYASLGVLLALPACATVQVRAPEEPIEINLNVKIEQEVRVRLDRDIEELIDENPDIF
ncbi:YnbE family lipoprotein [Parvularcula oceani]|uniref:YnbE family lipoprotein n=1 Tax=Parvularcula oceani TaxID=1247963 RepID=UPI0004E2787F|nr:YnbE family lipoprotein [Parvularcula oceani]